MIAAAGAPTSRLSGPTAVPLAPPLTARALKRLVEARVEQARARLAAAGVDAEIHVGWTPDHRSLVVRCAVLRDGAPDPRAKEAAAFGGGYLLRDLADLGVRCPYPGNARHLLVPFPVSPASASRPVGA
jgi:hypothetical protein